jgi:hypothetical protein
MTYAEFKAKYLGKKVDYDLAYNSQCVDLIRFYWKEVFNISQPKGVTGAKDFWNNYETDPNLKNNFDKILNTPNAVPKTGDIVIWSGSYGKYGHIAICDQADVNSLTCLSQNDPLGRETHLKKYNYNFIYGWFSPKGNMDYEKLYNEARIARDSWWSNMSKLIKATGLDFTEATANAKTDEAVKRITDTIEATIKLEKELASAQNQEARIARDQWWKNQVALCETVSVSGLTDQNATAKTGEAVKKVNDWIEATIKLEKELASAKKQADKMTVELNQTTAKLQAEIQAHKETTLKLLDCQSSSSSQGVSGWQENGLTIEVTDGNTKRITNYKKV